MYATFSFLLSFVKKDGIFFISITINQMGGILMTQAQIKQFFEQYYAKLIQNDANILPNVPPAMQANSNETEEWKHWKIIPSTVTEEDFVKLEEEMEIKLPNTLRLFLSTYHHYFENPIGRNPIDKPFQSLHYAYNPILIHANYLPFAWDKEGYFIRCICLDNMPDETKCSVYQIDHEILFDFDEYDETIQKEDIAAHMQLVAENFDTYLKQCFDDIC